MDKPARKTPVRVTTEQVMSALRTHRSPTKAARALGVSDSVIHYHRHKARGTIRPKDAMPLAAGKDFPAPHVPLPPLKLGWRASPADINAWGNRREILQALADGQPLETLARRYSVEPHFLRQLQGRARA